jgi:hypothetical protein
VYAKVTGYIPTGTVTFSLGGSGAMAQSPLVNGTAIYTAELSSSLCGTYAITANYSGDSNNAGSTGSANATFMSTSTTTLVATPVKVVQGNSVVLTATVSSPCTAPAPTGSVSFSVNGVIEGSADLEGTIAQISVPTSTDNAPGAYTVDATYAGDASHSGSSGSAVVTVVQ